MKKIYTSVSYCMLIALFSACSINEKGLADGVGDDAPNAVYMGNSNASGVISILASDETGASFAVTPRLASSTGEAITVTVEVDKATLEKYNNDNGLSVRPINPEDIRFVNANGEEGTGKITATILPGDVLTTIEGHLASLDATKYPYDGRYAIPVKITDVQGSLQLLSEPVSTIINLNRKIKTSVFHMKTSSKNGYTMRFMPKEPYMEEMSEWTMQYIGQFNNIHNQNQTTASLSSGHGFYNRISTSLGLQIKSEGRDGVDTWTGKPAKPGEWMHVSYVYRKMGLAGRLSVYVNGELQKTFTTSLLYVDNTKDAGWGFGNENVRDYYLREVRFWNRALTAAEIQDKYYLPEDPKANGLEAYFPMTEESYDKDTKTFTDLTGKWRWTINPAATYEIVKDVVFPATKLTIEADPKKAAEEGK